MTDLYQAGRLDTKTRREVISETAEGKQVYRLVRSASEVTNTSILPTHRGLRQPFIFPHALEEPSILSASVVEF
jgi:hypothetical protein